MTRTFIRGLTTVIAILALSASSVLASTVIDLTNPGSNNFAGNNQANLGGSFIVQQTSDQPPAGEVVDTFVRLQTNHLSSQGYNTDAATPQFDEVPADTHSLSLSDVPKVNLTVNGVTEPYRQFLLNIDQVFKSVPLSLNQVQIFLRDTGDATGAVPLAQATLFTPPVITFLDPFSIEVFRLNVDSPDFLQINLKDANTSGGGVGDMFLYVRDAVFQDAVISNPNNTFVYLYSQFGFPPIGYPNLGGSQDWSVLKSSPVAVPEPSTVVLAISGLGVLAATRLRRPKVQARA